MNKALKEVDYFRLVVLIYRTAGLNEELLSCLFNYVAGFLDKHKYDAGYVDKLRVDLNLFDVTIKDMSIVELRICKIIKRSDFLEFRGVLFDITLRGYYP